MAWRALTDAQPCPSGGWPRTYPARLIAVRGYDSNGLRRFLKRRHIQPIIPARSNNPQATDQDGRCLRRGPSAGSAASGELTVRYDRLVETYCGFFHVACAMITLRKVLK